MQGADTVPGEPLRLIVSETDQQIADCLRRLAQIPERAEAQIILRPAILRELHYWLLHGRHGALVRRLARRKVTPSALDGRGSAAADFAQRLPVRELAEAAGMSASAFHQHFKEATTLTPLQFQKQLRLIERGASFCPAPALSRGGVDVGYESVSQFSRDYSRMFGASPRRDVSTRGTLPEPRSDGLVAAGVATGHVTVILLLGDMLHRDHTLARRRVEHDYALAGAADNANAVHRAADELAGIGHSMIWSWFSTGKEAARRPLRSLTAMATMPLPPRPVTRYS